MNAKPADRAAEPHAHVEEAESPQAEPKLQQANQDKALHEERSDVEHLQQAVGLYDLLPSVASLTGSGSAHAVDDAFSQVSGSKLPDLSAKPEQDPRKRIRAAILLVVVIVTLAVGGLLVWRLALADSLADVAPNSAGAGFQGTCEVIDLRCHTMIPTTRIQFLSN